MEKENSSADFVSNTDIPEHLFEKYHAALKRTLPERSIKKYETAYHNFCEWQKLNKTNSIDEVVIMAYMLELSGKYVPPTLWSIYSMLKRMIINSHKVNIAGYNQLNSFLKNNAVGYESKKSNVFTPDQINLFMTTASDDKYLVMKTVMAFGLSGASRGDELVKLKFTDITENNGDYIIRIPDSKNREPRMYVICGELMTGTVRKYIQLRTDIITVERFFINYREGRCTNQVIGKNTIAAMPKETAVFLNLPNPEAYTGHSYRRTSATCAANAGASIETVMDIGDWKSMKVAKLYVQQSVSKKRQIGNLIAESTNMAGQSSTKTEAPKRMALSTSSSNIIVSSRKVEVMSQSVQEFGESSSVEAAMEEDETGRSVREVVDVPSCQPLAKETPVVASAGDQSIQMSDGMLAGRPVFHFTNCNDFKFSIGQ